MVRHLTIRLQLTWLTFAALGAFALVAAIRPEGGATAATFAGDAEAFLAALRPDDSILTINLFRAHLAADMIFLVAYGILLRQSALYTGRRPAARLARRAVIVAMAADAVENLCALAVLRSIGEESAGALPPALFLAMNAAAVVKWAVAGAVMLLLAVSWRPLIARLNGPLRIVGRGVAISFGAGGLASLIVAITPLFPSVQEFASTVAMAAPAIALLLQLRLLDMLGVAWRFAYLARVPLGLLVIAAAFGPAALGPAAPLLGSILDVPGWWPIAVVSAASLVLAFACVTQINLLRAYAWQRMLDGTLRVLRHRVLARAASATALVAVSSLIFCVALASLEVRASHIALGIAAGVLAAGTFLFLVEWLAALFSQNPAGRPMPQLAVPFQRAPLLGRLLRQSEAAPPPAPIASVRGGLRKWSFAQKVFGLSSGYIELAPGGGRRLLPGHTFAAIQFALSLAFFCALMYFKSQPVLASSPDLASGNSLVIPTAASILLLLLMSGWALSGLTFFFDRYRIPLLSAGILVMFVTGSSPRTDFEVPTRSEGATAYDLAAPADVLRKYPQPIVIAAAGGGIQAGAWGARVLQGIHAQLGDAVSDRVALVSSVSGGSMAALYYGAYRDTSLHDATRQSMRPSLDEIASALIGTDLLRIFGLKTGTDRGEALERSWRLRLPPSPAPEATLRAWSDRVTRFAHGAEPDTPFPAFLFNTTVVETGQPMAFATTQFPTARYRASFAHAVKQYPVAESANGLFKLMFPDGHHAQDVRLHVATAARLSAGFPYVSPATTVNITGRQRYHLVDGGYYDNYGIVALAQWLDDALEGMTERPREIGVVIIRGLVESDSGLNEELRQGETAKSLQAERTHVLNQGWAWQLTAPLSTLLKTRNFGQWAGGNQVLRLLIQKWGDRGVAIVPYLFEFPSDRLQLACRVAPLSWKLSAVQQRCIEDGWARYLQDAKPVMWQRLRGDSARATESK